MRRDQLPPYPSASYVMRRHKAVYISVPKAACTTLKWLVADLQGENPARFHASVSREVTRAMTIHRRALWRRTPTLHELSDAELDGISPENGWFVYAVVRHPAARLWSGWHSKILLREPRWEDTYGAESWWPRMPSSTDDVVEDFQRFALSLAERPDQRVLADRHFRRQERLIKFSKTPYSRVYTTTEIPVLLDDLTAHLRRQGWEGELSPAPSNETPLNPLARAFPPEVQAAIEQTYAPDFKAFGFDTVLPPKLDDAHEYPAPLLAEVGRLIERGERIGDLSSRAQTYRQALDRYEGRFLTVNPGHLPLRKTASRLRGRVRAKLRGRAPLRGSADAQR